MRRLLALVLLVGLGLTGCATSADARLRSQSEREPQPAAAAPVVGRVTVHVPAHASTVGVVVLHSFGHTEDEAVAQGWSAASDRHHFVAIYPYRSGSWNAGLCCGDAVEERRDDVAWLAATIEDVRRRYGLTSIYLAGFSNGGMMAERLVAERPEVASRIVTWGSAPELPRQGLWTGTAVLYNGELDQTVPWYGGTRTIGGQPTVIRPGVTTYMWLPRARMQAFVVPGDRHEPPASWPELAWEALNAPPGSAPTRPSPDNSLT